jgi:hypothetical protein
LLRQRYTERTESYGCWGKRQYLCLHVGSGSFSSILCK